MKKSGKNSFTGKSLVNLKQTFTYPNDGKIRFQIQLDKNGQVYEIRRSFAQIIKDAETKKRFVKVTLGERPRQLYDTVKGRPFEHAVPWILDYIENYIEIDDSTNPIKEA